MIDDKLNRASLVKRAHILDAAERLLAQGGAAFSMRELADAAGVSFATPFNHFGSKAAIMFALSARRIALMQTLFADAGGPETATTRVLMAVDIAVAVMLTAPVVNRVIMGAIGSPGEGVPGGEAGDVSVRSGALWAEALGTGNGLAALTRALALAVLPRQLAVAFRGVLSFWTAGELSDEMLGRYAHGAAATVLLGFVGRAERAALLTYLEP